MFITASAVLAKKMVSLKLGRVIYATNYEELQRWPVLSASVCKYFLLTDYVIVPYWYRTIPSSYRIGTVPYRLRTVVSATQMFLSEKIFQFTVKCVDLNCYGLLIICLVIVKSSLLLPP